MLPASYLACHRHTTLLVMIISFWPHVSVVKKQLMQQVGSAGRVMIICMPSVGLRPVNRRVAACMMVADGGVAHSTRATLMKKRLMWRFHQGGGPSSALAV